MKPIEDLLSRDDAPSDPAGGRRPSLAIFDLDRTITKFDTYLPFLGYLCRRRPSRTLWLPSLAPAVFGYWRGSLGNSRLKERFWEAIAGGLSEGDVRQLGRKFSEVVCRHGLRQGALRQIEEHRASGDRLILVSASFDVYVTPIGDGLGFDSVISTQAEIGSDGRVTGRIDGQNCYGAEKVRRLEACINGREGFVQSIVYSDHHSDIGLFQWADRGIAVHPTARLRREISGLPVEIVDDWS